MKTICVDYDGVIHPYSKGFGDGTIADEPPVDGAIEGMQRLIKRGYKIVILTARPNENNDVTNWLGKYWTDTPLPEITNVKPIAIAYVGKWMFRFSGNWDEILDPPVSDGEQFIKDKFIGTLPELTDGEWGYIGGLIDGEGSFAAGTTIHGNKYLRLIITNQHVDVLEWIESKFGGSVHTKKQIDGQHFPISWWTKSGIGMKLIIEKLLGMNLIRMKRGQAKLTLEYLDAQRYNGRTQGEFQKMQQEQRLLAISQLNKWGVAAIEPILIDDRAIRFTSWKDILNYF